MKFVLIVRHAKSSWDNFSVADFDRPLNDRGKEDGPKMAKRLLDQKISIDTFISSPAKRAKKTATLFAHEYGLKKDDIILVPELYHPATGAFLKPSPTLLIKLIQSPFFHIIRALLISQTCLLKLR